MTTYVALLYSISLSEGRRLVMSDLRAMASSLGLKAPRTISATGNLVFEAPVTAIARLETKLEAGFETAFGKHSDIIMRRADKWRRLIASNPFPKESRANGSRVAVRVMRRPLDTNIAAALEPFQTDGERLAIVDGDLWIHFAHDPGRSGLLASMTRKRSCGIGTTRNWNTVHKIGELLDTDQRQTLR